MKDYETLVKDIIQEENELKDKLNRLEYFMMTEDYQKISERQQILLTKQLNAMNNYKGCLISRVLQIRLEHEENKGCTCEPEEDQKIIPFSACKKCKWSAAHPDDPNALRCNKQGTVDYKTCWEARE